MSPYNKQENGTRNGTPKKSGSKTNEIILTDIVVKNLKPADKRVDYSVTGMPGLVVRVQPSGRKTFSCLYRFDGVRKRVTFGKYGEITVHQALAKYAEAMSKIDQGLDPSEEISELKQRKKEAGRIDDLIERYEKHCHSIGKKDVRNEITCLRSSIGKVYGKKPLNKVTKKDCASVISEIIARDAPSQANHVYQYMKRMFNLAVDWGLLDLNPMQGMKKPAPVGRKQRVLNYKEIYLFLNNWPRCGASKATKEAMQLILFTLMRGQEVRLSKWAHFDESNGILSLNETKNNIDVLVPLNKLALSCVQNMKEFTSDSAYIFSLPPEARVADKGGEYFQPLKKSSLAQSVRRFLASDLGADIEPFSPHDLRRSAATHLTSLGVPTYWVKLLLNHQDHTVTRQHYDLYSYIKEKKKALDVWEFALTEILSAEDVDKVISLEDLRGKVEERFTF